MALLGNKKTKSDRKPVTLANSDIERFRKWDKKTLADIDDMEPTLMDIRTGKSRNPNNQEEIYSLVLEFPNEKVAIPLSRKFNHEDLSDPDVALFSMVRISNKALPGEAPANASGPLYISFGRPSGITFEEEVSVVEHLAVAEP